MGQKAGHYFSHVKIGGNWYKFDCNEPEKGVKTEGKTSTVKNARLEGIPF
jgi:ubiquitin C-terminal hydrolase